jgi:hypothetical protein
MKAPQFHINDVQTGDQECVAEIFSQAVEMFHLLDTKLISRSENIICSNAESRGFEFGLGAWLLADRIVIGFNPGKEATEQFHEVFAFVVSQLRGAFEHRFASATVENYVEVPNTLPQTEGARAIYRSLLRKTDKS